MNAVEKIRNKVKNLSFGKAANLIQAIANEVCSKTSINRFLKAMKLDLKECAGMDGMLINGEYFDWKEFEWRKEDMLYSFLGYFTDNELEKIAQAI